MKSGYAIYWSGVKKELEGFITQKDIQILISRINFHDFNPDQNLMILSVPSNFVKDNVSKYKDDMESSLTKVYGHKCQINFIVAAKKSEPIIEKQEKQKSDSFQQKKSPVKKKNEDYTFDSFVVGNSNEFAAKAAQAVAENPGTQYNPYFVWGDSGLGKTHLLKAIEKYVKDNYPAKKIKYITSEEFTNDFVNSIRSNSMERFRLKYRKLDLLLIDDVQFFADKEGIQQEFFNTFNKLYDNFKQMVFSCDQPIKKVKKMEDRLRSRFAMGLVVDLRSPDFELKMAIVKNLADIYSLKIDPDAMEYICSNIGNNIRDLKGAFQALLAYSSIMKKPIALDVAKETLKDRISSLNHSPVSVDKIIQVVAEYYNLKSHEIIGKKRTQSIVLARQIAMYISRKITMLSTTQIGKYFGDKEHGTVMHATKKIDDMIVKDSNLKNNIDMLIDKIKSD